MDQEGIISSAELARIIGKSERYVQILVKKGAISKLNEKAKNRYDIYSCVQEYITFIQKQQNSGSLEERKLQAEVDYKEAKAAIMQIELDEIEGRMHSAEDVESMTTDLCLAIRSALLSLPGRLAVDLSEKDDPQEISELIKTEVYDILDDLSRYEYNPDEYKRRVREKQGWLEKIEQDDEDGEG